MEEGGNVSESKPDAGWSAVALGNQTTYREHLHRSIMAYLKSDEPSTGIVLAFWPTCRQYDQLESPPPNINCQRCGKRIRSGKWWCYSCWQVMEFLQVTKGMTPVQVCASGEYDPPLGEWIQDHAPWLIPQRIEVAQEPNQLLKKKQWREKNR